MQGCWIKVRKPVVQQSTCTHTDSWINCKPILCFLVISSWGIENLIKQKCENRLKWIFHQFLSWLKATVPSRGHFTALFHAGHSCSSPLPKPYQLHLVHICEFEVALTTTTGVGSFPFHKNTKLLHASQHCCPSVGPLLTTDPQGCPCPGTCPPWATVPSEVSPSKSASAAPCRLLLLSSPLWVSRALRADALSYVYWFMASSTTGQPCSLCYRKPNSYARYILL